MRIKILIIDDDPDILDLIENILAVEDYDVYRAGDGIEALEIFQAQPVDLVISFLVALLQRVELGQIQHGFPHLQRPCAVRFLAHRNRLEQGLLRLLIVSRLEIQLTHIVQGDRHTLMIFAVIGPGSLESLLQKGFGALQITTLK